MISRMVSTPLRCCVIRIQIARRQLVDLRNGHAGRARHLLLVEAVDVLLEGLEAVAVAIEEVVVEHRAGIRALGVEHTLRDGLQQRHVAAGADLDELIGDLRRLAEVAADPLRILVPDQPRFGQRVDRDDPRAVLLRLLQCGEHAGVVGARVLAHDDDQVGFAEILVGDRRLADPDGVAHGGAGRLVAHVRAVGEVVGAEHAREELVDERRLVGGAAARVEGGLVRVVEGVQVVGDQLERGVPPDRLVVIRPLGLVDGLDQTALHAEPVLGLVLQRADRMLPPERALHLQRRRLPGHRLAAVLAELRDLAMVRIRPRAAHAVEAVLVVDLRHELRGAGEAHVREGGFHRVEDAAETGGVRLRCRHLDVGVREVVFRGLGSHE